MSISYRDETDGECCVVWRKEDVVLAEGSKSEKTIFLFQEGQKGSFVFSVN